MSAAAGVFILIGRLLIGGYFATVAGPVHLRQGGMMQQYAQSQGLPMYQIAGWPTGAWLIAGGLSVALGIWPDLGALMIAAFAVVAALYFHRFWAIDDPNQKMNQTLFFWRNVVIVGACVFMFGTFVGLGSELRYAITTALFDF